MKHLLSRQGVGIALLVATMVVGVLWGSAITERGVERAVRENSTAAGLLSRLQVEGEKMRRYEKEMFIYVAVPDKRNGYVKEFDTAYTRLLGLSNDMLAPSSKAFTNAERGEIAKWKLAATFYGAEFNKLAQRDDVIVDVGFNPRLRAEHAIALVQPWRGGGPAPLNRSLDQTACSSDVSGARLRFVER